MTELMKQFEKETGGDAIILYEKHISDEFARWVNSKYLALQAENAQLKARVAELEKENERLRGIVHNLDHTLITNGEWSKV